MTPNHRDHARSVRYRRIAGRTLLATSLAVGLVAGCSDDDDAADAEAAYCDERADLREELDELANADLVADGADSVREDVDGVSEQLAEVREAGGEVVGDEADALRSALDDLRSAVAELGDSGIGQENRSGVVDAVEGVRSAGSDLLAALDTDCE
ncbi:MAG: hypothetical protein S0880_14125 [Actinomycetota bacterium]|nr:hypothetical protein [Actinomycetota bacterium]